MTDHAPALRGISRIATTAERAADAAEALTAAATPKTVRRDWHDMWKHIDAARNAHGRARLARDRLIITHNLPAGHPAVERADGAEARAEKAVKRTEDAGNELSKLY